MVIIILYFSLKLGDGHKMHQGQLCKSSCSGETEYSGRIEISKTGYIQHFCGLVSVSWDTQKGQRHTYRYSTTITSSMKGPTSGGSQLAFDCVVDIDTLPGCPDMILRVCIKGWMNLIGSIRDLYEINLVSFYVCSWGILRLSKAHQKRKTLCCVWKT